MILEHIEGPWDVKNLNPEELKHWQPRSGSS